MTNSLNSFFGVILGIIYGTAIGVLNGDTTSLDYSSHGETREFGFWFLGLGDYWEVPFGTSRYKVQGPWQGTALHPKLIVPLKELKHGLAQYHNMMPRHR